MLAYECAIFDIRYSLNHVMSDVKDADAKTLLAVFADFNKTQDNS